MRAVTCGEQFVFHKQRESFAIELLKLTLVLCSTDDAARLSAKAKSHLPGTGKEIKTEGKVLASEAGAKLDDAVCDIFRMDPPR